MKTRMCCVSALVSLLFIVCAMTAPGAPYPFEDDVESGPGNWTVDGLWGETTLSSHSGTRALTDSPGRFYTNDTDNAATLNSGINLSGATSPVLTFYHRHSLESGYDEATVEVSTDGGSSWISPALASYTGNLGSWTREQLDLSAYAGQSDVRIRFRVQTDVSVVKDGWYIDDVAVGEAPAAVGAFTAVSGGTNSVDLSWSASAGPDLASYHLYRSLQPDVDWRTGTVIAELGSAVTSHTDIAVSPKSTYYYMVMAIDTSERHALSSEQSATTATGMDYPFLDNGEGGGNTWNAEAPWALSDEDALSATHSWSDSPGTNYENSVNASLTLAAPIDLSAAVAPALCFAHKYEFASGDSGNAEVSINGSDWTRLGQFTGSSGSAWVRERYDLSAYIGQVTVYVRLRFTSDHANVADGWHVDDISVAESPDTINAPIITEVASHSMRLTWAACTNEQFASYAVYRSTASGVDFNDTLVTTITARATTSCVVTGLALDTEYYFRVYAVSSYGTYSANGTENHDHTLNHPIPFTEDFEGSLEGWNLTGSWGVETNNPYSGTFNLADSPGNAPYALSTDSSATTAVDLRGSSWPVLRFRDRFDLAGGDGARVEISTDGNGWAWIYGLYEGGRTNWAEQTLDLSEWKNASNLRIRFHFFSDGGADTLADGWMIDALSVEEHTPVALSVPFHEGFENGMSNWLHAAWRQATNEAYVGSASVVDSDTARMPGDYYTDVGHRLALGGTLDFAGMTNPQLTFWLKGHFDGASYLYFRVHVSTDGGVSWQERTEANRGGFNIDWTRVQCDLTPYAGQEVRLRFYVSGHRYSPNSEIYIDKITVEERTPNVILNAPVPHLKSVDLTWAASSLGAAFQRYELRRDTNPNIDLNDLLIGAFTNAGDTAFTDTGLSIGQTYYYRLFAINTNDTYSIGAERAATTVPISLGFSDPMETVDLWDMTGSWGVDSNHAHEGNACLSDSPGDLYAPSSDSYMLTAVDLTGSTWPVLTFRDRFELSGGDGARVEISTDGNGWAWIYGIQEGTRTNWAEQTLDLSEWKNASNLRIRFHLWSDSSGATTGDGWMIDALSVEEHTPVALSVPFHEGFENGMSNWLHAAWHQAANEAYVGSASVVDSDTARMPGDYYSGVGHRLALGGPLDFAGMTNPQLTFWLKGQFDGASYLYFRVHVSTDGGVSWQERTEANRGGFNMDWTRVQCDLTPYAGQEVRLRFYVAGHRYSPNSEIYIDKITVEERTPNVILNAPVPHLKSVDLTWAASSLGAAFQRYELRRDTNPNVDLNDLLIGTFTNAGDTAYSDAGLSIGQTYYYRLFVINTDDTYSIGAERAATTVPIRLGFSDPMESVDLWDVTGSWGVDSNHAYEGSACLSDSPGDLYAPSSDSYMLTAVDLTGSTWPVLTFRDRFELSGGDGARVEVSTDGSGWAWIYGIQEGTRTNWAEQTLDLSEWKNASNLRIRFHLWSDTSGATTGDGWMIDALSVEEHTPVALSVPFHEGFENGMSNWLHAAWRQATNEAYVGSASVVDSDTARMPGDYYTDVGHRLALGGTLDFAGMTNPQLTFWLKGHFDSASYLYFRVHVSTDGGVSWQERTEANRGGFNIDWTRVQCDLTPYAGQEVRLRFYVGGHRYSPNSEIYIDKITVEERTPDVILNALTPHQKSIDLSWNMSGPGAAFQRYEVRRDVNAVVDLNDELIGTFTNISTLSMTDAGLTTGTRYYYRLYVVNTNDTYSQGAEQSAVPTPLRFGFTDPMESLDRWIVSGRWGVDTNAAHSGAGCLTDTPNTHYDPSTDTWLLTSVDLTGADWPILRFWDRFELAGGDWARVEISTDGAGWAYLYGLYDGARTNWTEQIIDLSEWKNYDNVRIRFRVGTDGSAATTADGWMIDDVSVIDHTPAAISYPFFDGFENGIGNWLHAPWRQATNEAQAGAACVVDSDTQLMPGEYYQGTSHRLVLGAALNLSNAVTPKLTFWLKGHLLSASYLYFRVHASTDGGLTWQERTEANYGSFDIDWTRVQCDLSSYVGQTVRLRFYVNGHRYNPNTEIYIDNVGIGEPTPGAPTLHSPLQLESVPVLRPTLRVYNATDFQGDALDYEFEVYSDALFSNKVASVPAVAQGVSITAWEIDTDLPDGAQYWWRCRAADAGGAGPWMDPAIFYVNHVNNPPYPVKLVGPPPASILHDLSHVLVWRPTSDQDTGGIVENYHMQIAPNAAFTNLVVDDATITVGATPTGPEWTVSMPLSAFSGSDGLRENTSYFWRMRADDQWDAWSDWSTNELWFIYGTPPPNITRSTRMTDGSFDMGWERSGKQVTVEFSPSLDTPDWQTVSGPIYGTNATVTIPSDKKRGYFRVKTE